MKARYRSLMSYRGFIVGSVRREFNARYRNSLLGVLWSLITPLATIIIYVVIFSNLMRARLDGVDNEFAYGAYICAGVLTWGAFSEVITRCQNVFIENANMLKKLSFPRLCLPIIVLSGSVINLCIVLVLFLLFLLFSGNWPGWPLLALLPVLAVQLLLSVSLGVILGVINVFFRDVAQLTGILLQFWFWFTPIVYPITILPDPVKKLVLLNPMTHVIGGYQQIFVYAAWPDWGALLLPLTVAVLFLLMAAQLFRKRGGEMVDEL